MKFILSDTNCCFSQVQTNQFFINQNGKLCQKIDYKNYNVIANAKGEPYAGFTQHVEERFQIQRILPIVEKIEF